MPVTDRILCGVLIKTAFEIAVAASVIWFAAVLSIVAIPVAIILSNLTTSLRIVGTIVAVTLNVFNGDLRRYPIPDPVAIRYFAGSLTKLVVAFAVIAYVRATVLVRLAFPPPEATRFLSTSLLSVTMAKAADEVVRIFRGSRSNDTTPVAVAINVLA